MDDVTKLNLKIQALRETYTKRTNDLDEEVANLRVALTEVSQTLQTTQQEFEGYKQRHPEETDVPQEDSPSSEE